MITSHLMWGKHRHPPCTMTHVQSHYAQMGQNTTPCWLLHWMAQLGQGRRASPGGACEGVRNPCKQRIVNKRVYCETYCDTLQLPQGDFLLCWGCSLQGRRACMRGQGNEWDWGAWYDILRESIKRFEIKKKNNLLFFTDFPKLLAI